MNIFFISSPKSTKLPTIKEVYFRDKIVLYAVCYLFCCVEVTFKKSNTRVD